MSRVVVKGELHSSSGDLDEERELLKENFDALILEGQASKSDYGWADGWFQLSIIGFFWIMGRIYISKEILVEMAEIQGTELIYTRESDAEVLQNTPIHMKAFSALLFYILVPGSIPVGLVFGNLPGASVFLLGMGLPLLGIRIFNYRRNRGEKNRDKIIADKIEQEFADDRSVLAIIGSGHLQGVLNHLPEEINPEVRNPAYPYLCRESGKELLFPLIEAILVLYSVYLLVSWTFLRIIQFIPSFN